MATTIKIPAPFVPHLHSAAIYTLGEEAKRVHEAEQAVWKAEAGGRPEKISLAKDDLSNVRPYVDKIIPLAQAILALPIDQDAELEDEPDLLYYVLHNMASKILGPRIAAELVFLPMPDEVPPLADALRWASAESIRLEAVRVEEIRHEKGKA